MKIEFDPTNPEERDEVQLMLKAGRYQSAFEDVWQQMMRPHYKHGYPVEFNGELEESELISKFMDHLSKVYREIKEENDI